MQPRVRIYSELAAGLLTWLVVAVPLLVEHVLRGGLAPSPRTSLWWAAWAAFGVIYIAVAWARLGSHSASLYRLLLVGGAGAAAAATLALPEFGLTSILFIITATMAAHILRAPAALMAVAGQGAIITLAAMIRGGDALDASIEAASFACFMLFAFLTTRAGLSEAAAKEELALGNAELRATQHLLAESQRTAERLRIARELHDVVGHHLTVLILNLEVASRRSEGKAKEAADHAHAVAKSLMSDVRVAVRAIRDDDEIDLTAALTSLVENVPHPAVHLALPDDLRVRDPQRAHALFRCVQEVITNAAKHADARNVWIDIQAHDGGLVVQGRDDGRGVSEELLRTVDGRADAHPEQAVPDGSRGSGLGLASMRARFEAVGGRLTYAGGPGVGFSVTAYLPEDDT